MKRMLVDLGIAWTLIIGFGAALLLAQRTTGITRDEGYYFRAAEGYFSWIEKASDPKSRTPEVIDRHFSYNHEHPALLKTLFGASTALFHEKLGWLTFTSAMRLPGILFSALALGFLYFWGVRAHSRMAGIAAALLYATIPRVFFHSQLACFDAAIATLVLAVTAGFSRTLESRIAILATGILFGVALSIKLNAFFVPPVLLVWVLLFRRSGWRRGLVSLVVMLLVGGAIFYALWPWLWPDPLRRLGDYLGFHKGHSYYNTEYLGVNYNRPPLPVSYPFVMTLLTTPVVTLALFAMGLAIALARAALRPRAWLWLLSLLAPMTIIAWPTVPIFGGTKHWLPAMPFLTLFAAIALAEVASRLSARWKPVLLSLAIAPGLVSTAHLHPFTLSHYNALAGGVAGAADMGMLRQFWGYPTRQLLPWMNESFPPNARIYFHDTNHDSVTTYKREGLLRRDLRDSGMEWTGIQSSDHALVIHELHFAKYEIMIWNAYQTVRPSRVLTLDGVPLVTVYERPRGYP